MNKQNLATLGNLARRPGAVRYGIILLIAAFAMSGSLFSQELAKNKAAGSPCVKGNCVNGKGEMNFATGDVYKGAFRKGLSHGQGEMIWKSGDRYRGNWRDGRMDGRGDMKWAIGDRYDGMWKDNQMNGAGTMTWKNGMKYSGQWKNGKQHGNGVLTSTDRKVTRGKWENGTMIIEPPKGGAVPEPIGKYGRYSILNPDDTRFGDSPDMEYNFVKGGTGTWKRLNSESGASGNVTWKLDKNELSISLGMEGAPMKYIYDSGKKYFTEVPRPYGPFEKVQVVSILKKQ